MCLVPERDQKRGVSRILIGASSCSARSNHGIMGIWGMEGGGRCDLPRRLDHQLTTTTESKYFFVVEFHRLRPALPHEQKKKKIQFSIIPNTLIKGLCWSNTEGSSGLLDWLSGSSRSTTLGRMDRNRRRQTGLYLKPNSGSASFKVWLPPKTVCQFTSSPRTLHIILADLKCAWLLLLL